MLVVDRDGGFQIDRNIELDYDQWDRITLKNLINSYDSQMREFYHYLDKVGNDGYNQEWVQTMLEEANDTMSHLEPVIEYYSIPNSNYCKQIRDHYNAKRKIAKMGSEND